MVCLPCFERSLNEFYVEYLLFLSGGCVWSVSCVFERSVNEFYVKCVSLKWSVFFCVECVS